VYIDVTVSYSSHHILNISKIANKDAQSKHLFYFNCNWLDQLLEKMSAFDIKTCRQQFPSLNTAYRDGEKGPKQQVYFDNAG